MRDILEGFVDPNHLTYFGMFIQFDTVDFGPTNFVRWKSWIAE